MLLLFIRWVVSIRWEIVFAMTLLVAACPRWGGGAFSGNF